ncbi:MAG: hypothetical protein EOM50_09225 [Erysipelotrichia bacterium]|nr:hypothetical protein [Erysipelotrichia bacterium]NCC54647.1 hypothetical protein [Erysipelotrichia bacterium]
MISNPLKVKKHHNDSKEGLDNAKGVKFKLYPNKRQQSLIVQTLGCCA